VSYAYRSTAWSLILCLVLESGVLAQGEATQVPPVPPSPRADQKAAVPPEASPAPTPGPVTYLPPGAGVPATTFNQGPVTMRLDPCTGFPPEGPPISLFSPWELYVRSGAALSTGRGPLSDVLRTGVGIDSGLRSFLFDLDHSASWYGDLGLSYLYNEPENASVNLITDTGQVGVNRLGQVIGLDAVTQLGIRELHRASARLTFGREYYFNSFFFDGWKYSLGGDFGGVWGWAHVKTQINTQTITGSQPGDVVQNDPRFNHRGDQIKGFFFGTSFNMILPRNNYDFIVGSRLEWERHYFKLADNDDGSSQLKLLLELGWRF
jgi:hypothetical protein